MGIAEQMEQIIKSQLGSHVAWMPITNNYMLGDYGLISNGVFNKMGNIGEDFGVAFSKNQGPDASLDFTSSSTSIIKYAGGVQVDVIPAGAIDAKISLKFEKDRSLLIKAPTISVSNIQNVNAVFEQLKAKDNWNKKYTVVYQTYLATDADIISTIDAGTEINFSGDASALQQFKLGSASIDVNANKKVGLQILGKVGVIALGLVRLRSNFLEKPIVFLGSDEPIEVEDLKGVTLEDDL